jgi:hypothetical protein
MKKRISVPRAESYFADRKARADLPTALKILKRAGTGKPPVKVTSCRCARRRAQADADPG